MTIKDRINQTKQFVEDHKTTVACTATAVVAYKLGYRIALKGAIEGVTDVAYVWGARTGVAELQSSILRDFIAEKGMKTELFDYIKQLGEELA